MKTIVSLLITLLLSVVSYAQTFTVSGLNYEVLESNQVKVTGGNFAFTNLTIPAFVTNNGTEFIVREIGDSAFENGQLESVVLPNSIFSIQRDAFRNNQLTDVTLGNRVEVIDLGAFRNNQIVEITIPASMINIENGAFRDNTTLRRIYALGTTPAIVSTSGVDNDSFRDRSVINLTVPEGSEETYANADWINFFSVNGQYTREPGEEVAANGFTYKFLSGNPNQVSIIDNTNSGDIIIGPRLTTRGVRFDVVTLEQDAFKGDNITSVTLPNTLVTIGVGAFFDNQLTDVTIPNSVITVGQDAFRDNQLTAVTLGNSVELLDQGAFRNNQIAAITIPASMKTIENGVFRENETLRIITALGTTPATIVNGDDNSFGDRSVIGLFVPEGGEVSYAASGWTGFFSVNGVYTGELDAQFINNNITYKIISRATPDTPNTAHIVDNTNTGAIEIEEVVTESATDFEIVAIEQDAFKDNDITSVTLPNTLVTIDIGAFFDNQLTNVTIPNSVIDIGRDAFRGNDLTTVTLGDGVETLGPGAFRNNQIAAITIPASMKTIENGVFRDNTNLRIITALGTTPATIVNGDDNSFGDRSVIGLFVPEGGEVSYAASGWTGFFSVYGVYTGELDAQFINNNITYKIISSATPDTPNTAHIVDNTNTGAIEIEEVVTESATDFEIVAIERDAFKDNDITSVTLPNTLVTIDIGAFFDNQLTDVIIPNSVIEIGRDAFRGNDLTTVTLGDGAETLGPGAFRNNQIEEISLPASMTSLAEGVFRENINLRKVTALGTTPASIETGGVDFDSFRDRSVIDLIVPEGTTQAYIDAGWTGFKSITEFAIDITVSPKVFLQGASLNPIAGEENLMRDDLRVAGLIPTTSPYSDAATLPTMDSASNPDSEDDCVDWVFVELRDANDNTSIVASQSALLQRDGDVVAINGTSLSFDIDQGDYFVAIKHRNHLGILSANTVALSSTVTAIDFTTDSTLIQGSENALTEISEGVFALIAGDFDENGQVQPSDVNDTTAAIGTSAYSNADMDMNGQIQPADVNNLVNPNVGRGVQF